MEGEHVLRTLRSCESPVTLTRPSGKLSEERCAGHIESTHGSEREGKSVVRTAGVEQTAGRPRGRSAGPCQLQPCVPPQDVAVAGPRGWGVRPPRQQEGGVRGTHALDGTGPEGLHPVLQVPRLPPTEQLAHPLEAVRPPPSSPGTQRGLPRSRGRETKDGLELTVLTWPVAAAAALPPHSPCQCPDTPAPRCRGSGI